MALGWQPEACAAFGIPWKEQVPRFGEAIEILQLLFAKDPADYRGRFYPFQGVSFQPKPVHGRIPLWIGAGAEPAIRRTARLGDAWIIGPLSAREVVKAQGGLQGGTAGVRQGWSNRRVSHQAGCVHRRGPGNGIEDRRAGAQSGLPRGQREPVGGPDRRGPTGLDRTARAAKGTGALPCPDLLHGADSRAHSARHSEHR
jgi:hypothetical protein